MATNELSKIIVNKTPSVLYTTSVGAKSSFSRPAVVKVVDQLELFNHLLS